MKRKTLFSLATMIALSVGGEANANEPFQELFRIEVSSVDEWRPIKGSLDAIARLNQAGFHVAVASNQSAVGRGLISIETLTSIHEHMHKQVAAHGGAIDAVFFCPCPPDTGCECRKPAPGLMLEILKRTRCTADKVKCIGDSLRDLQAAERAGMQPVLVRTGNGAVTETDADLPDNVPVYDSLASAVDAILEARKAGTEH